MDCSILLFSSIIILKALSHDIRDIFRITSNSGEGTILVDVQPSGITIKSVFGSLLALGSF